MREHRGAGHDSTYLKGMFPPPAKTGDVRIVRFDLDMRLRSGEYFLGLGCSSHDLDGYRIRGCRDDLIHLAVRASSLFEGLADLSMSVSEPVAPTDQTALPS